MPRPCRYLINIADSLIYYHFLTEIYAITTTCYNLIYNQIRSLFKRKLYFTVKTFRGNIYLGTLRRMLVNLVANKISFDISTRSAIYRWSVNLFKR